MGIRRQHGSTDGATATSRSVIPFRASFSAYSAVAALLLLVTFPFGYFALETRIYVPSLVLFVAWTGMLGRLPLLERDANTLLVPTFAKQQRSMLRIGMLLVFLLSAVQGAVTGWSPLNVIIVAANIIALGIILAVAPFLGVLLVVFLLSFAEMSVTFGLLMEASDASNHLPAVQILVTVVLLGVAYLAWARRFSFADPSASPWKHSLPVALSRLQQRGQIDKLTWTTAQSRLNRPFVLASRMHGLATPHLAMRSVLGYPFHAPLAGRLLLVFQLSLPSINLIIGICSFDRDDLRFLLRSMNVGLVFLFVSVHWLRRLHGNQNNASELAELSLLPGFGPSHGMHRTFLRGIFGGMAFELLSAIVLSTAAIAIAELACGKADWIAPSLVALWDQFACWIVLSCAILFFMLVRTERTLLPKIFFGCVLFCFYFHVLWEVRHILVGVTAIIGWLFYRQWRRQPHPFLLQ
ncbi:MAG: hypothetical protein JNN30_15870 [Rhodanobacteraceae bacterium]|nr:hypothetical protein [Rhodanobacteraceae bacterium]